MIADVIIEPEQGTNASAMLLSALLLYEHDPEALLLFLPSDHYIPQTELFLEFIHHMIDFTEHNNGVTILGLKPTHPTIGSGYIAYNETNEFPTKITSLHHSFDAESADHYYQKGYLWNSNIIAAKAETIIELAKKNSPSLYQKINDYIQGCGDYSNIPMISIDDVFCKKTDPTFVLAADFTCYDTTDLETYLSLRSVLDPQENHIQIDAHNNLIEAQDSIVAIVGLDNICVIQKDDILLVVHRNQVEKVKQIIDTLKKNQKEEYL